jgi:Uma2 family endonuclease
VAIDVASLSPERVRPLRRSEYERLVELGAFDDERVELLRGALATAGVPEYWIVNLVERVVEVHRTPANGRYTQVSTCRPGERLELGAFPDVVNDVRELLG